MKSEHWLFLFILLVLGLVVFIKHRREVIREKEISDLLVNVWCADLLKNLGSLRTHGYLPKEIYRGSLDVAIQSLTEMGAKATVTGPDECVLAVVYRSHSHLLDIVEHK
jgi:hypothetical protein